MGIFLGNTETQSLWGLNYTNSKSQAKLVEENLKLIGESGKILVRYRGNFVLIVGENGEIEIALKGE